MKENQQLIVFMHLSQLFNLFSGFLGFIIPLVIWQSKKKNTYDLDVHGKAIINFQISLFILTICCFPLVLFLGIGLIGLCILILVSLAFPVLNAVRASAGSLPN
ncbi:DUF4870 domain-containing protein [Flavobacteriaceae bacterium]|nr:DUF4870 domain-containing protein [Flavobacteriaceae bacterium]